MNDLFNVTMNGAGTNDWLLAMKDIQLLAVTADLYSLSPPPTISPTVVFTMGDQGSTTAA